MRLNPKLVKVAGAGLLVAFASTDAVAQWGTGGIDAAELARRAATDALTRSQGPWKAGNITATRPFGNIDVSGAGTSSDSIRTWSQGRTAPERSELSGRCGVINNPTYSARYSANAQQFCRNYMTASAASPSSNN